MTFRADTGWTRGSHGNRTAVTRNVRQIFYMGRVTRFVVLFRAKKRNVTGALPDTFRSPAHGYRRTYNNHRRRVKRLFLHSVSSKRTKAPKAGHVERILITVLRAKPKRWSNDNTDGNRSMSWLGREGSFPNASRWLRSDTSLRLNFHITQMVTGHGCLCDFPFRTKRAESRAFVFTVSIRRITRNTPYSDAPTGSFSGKG